MSMKKAVTVKKALSDVFSEDELNSYITGLNFVYDGIHEVYEKALESLMKGDTELALKYMIFGLDLDKTYVPLLNLCRTMLFGLSDIVNDVEFEKYRKKYKNFKDAKNVIEFKANELHARRNELEHAISDLEDKINEAKPRFFSFKKLYIFYVLTNRKVKPLLQEYNFEIENSDIVIKKIEQELKRVTRLNKIELSLKILTTIVEFCAIPLNFDR